MDLIEVPVEDFDSQWRYDKTKLMFHVVIKIEKIKKESYFNRWW